MLWREAALIEALWLITSRGIRGSSRPVPAARYRLPACRDAVCRIWLLASGTPAASRITAEEDKGANMTYKEKLEIVANITELLTVVGAVGVWCYYQYGFIRKRNELEKCLEQDGKPYKKLGTQGAFTVQHIAAKTGLTESEVFHASFKNRRINRLERLDADGYTKEILFQYND